MDTHTRGFLLTLLGVLVLTPDTLLIRLVDTDPWTVAVWRGALAGAVVLAGFIAVRGREALGEMVALGAAGLLVAGLYAVTNVAFVVALHYTSVANTLIILAISPLIAALLSRTMLGERVAGPTWIAIGAGFCGIAIVVSDGLGRGTALGDGLALVVATSLAGTFVLIRRRRELNMIPATALGKLLSALVVLPLADPGSLAGAQIPYALLMSALVLPVSFCLLTLGPRTIPAPEVALLLLLETVLGPLWVWLGVGERPTTAAFVGGGIVIATLVAHSAWRLRRRPAVPRAA